MQEGPLLFLVFIGGGGGFGQALNVAYRRVEYLVKPEVSYNCKGFEYSN